MSPEIVPESSTRYARETTRAEWLWRIVAIGLIGALLAMPIRAMADEPAPGATIEFDIPQQRADLALTQFAEQANLTLLFPFDGVRDRTANALTGEYTLDEAIEVLLAGTGLTPTFKNALVLDIAIDSDPTRDEDSMNTKKKAGVVAVLAGVLTGGVQAQEPTVTETEIQTSVVTGTVTDARTGRNLRGAKVTIEETGQWTSTGDLGRFRFAGVRSGSVTVTVSFLGYAGQSAVIELHGNSVSQDFALRGGSEIEEIIVFGTRSARAIALNRERTAENLTAVASSDLLGQFEGNTLAETLRRVPGATFVEDDLTGDGTNIIIRGLAPDFNQVRLDGQRLAEGSGVGRSPSIGNILTESIDEVTISKTLLPNQDSAGSGGLVEITTKGPLDRERRFASFSADHTWNDGFTDEQLYSGTVSGQFGKRERFGLSASVQFRDSVRDTVSYSNIIDAFGQYLPNAADGTPVTSIDSLPPLLGFPFEAGVDEVYPFSLRSSQNTVDNETVAFTLVSQWEPAENTELRLSYVRSEQDIEVSERSNDFLTQAFYVEGPVEELGGEVRGAYQWQNAFESFGIPGSFATNSGAINAREIENTTDVLSFEGATSVGAWDFDYRLSGSKGTSNSLSRITAYSFPGNAFFGFFTEVPDDFLTEEALQNTNNGNVVSLFRPITGSSFNAPLLNSGGYAFFNDPENYVFESGNGIGISRISGENDRTSGALKARYNTQIPHVSYIEVGIEYEESRFEQDQPGSTRYTSLGDLSLADLGLSAFTGDNLAAVGIDGGFLQPSDAAVDRLFSQLDSLSEGDGRLFDRIDDDRSIDSGTFTDEKELAAYFQARLEYKDFELIGGVRYSDLDTTARSFTAPRLTLANGQADTEFEESFRRLVDLEGSQAEFLPRVSINYRPSDNFVVRAGYHMSVARPRIENVSGRQDVTLDLRQEYGPAGNQPLLLVSQGNPDLEPAITHSFDLSASWYDDNAGVLQASVFYKEIENFLEFTRIGSVDNLDGIVLPEDPRFQNLPDNIFVDVIKPVNNDDDATIWGFEVVAEHQLVDLPGAWSGLGIFANYTYTDSEKTTIFENLFDPVTGAFFDFEAKDVPFNGAPEHSGTVAIIYNMHGFDASLAYTEQSERLAGYELRGLSTYIEGDSSLDLLVEYQTDLFGGKWSFIFGGTDLLKDGEDADTGVYVGDEYYQSATFFGGRTYSLGFRASY